MKEFLKRMSVVPKGLRYKLHIAFCLMSLIPLLVCVYLVHAFIFPESHDLTQVSIIVLFTILIAVLGLVLAKGMIDPVIDMALETKIIASGDFGRKLEVREEGEVGDLGRSINLITRRIKDYMDELQSYSIKTKEVNIEIQKKVLALTGLLQIGDMIATSTKLDSILDIIVEKTGEIEEESFTILFLAKGESKKMVPVSTYNIDKRTVGDLSFDIGKGYLGAAVSEKRIIKIDLSVKKTSQAEEVCSIFNSKNCIVVPVTCHTRGIGFLFMGINEEPYRFRDDDIELVKVMSKHLGLAIENYLLLKRAEELAIKDELTGLYNERYIRERLDEEIKRAVLYQRPCSFLLFNIDNFKELKDELGEISAKNILKKIASLLEESATEVSRVGRLGGDEFAMVLPEKNKKEATQLAEDIRRKVEQASVKEVKKGVVPLTVSGGVSENPIDGMSAKELFNKAFDLMKRAKLEGKNRIVA